VRARLPPALLQANPALLHAGTCDKIPVAAAFADRRSFGCSSVGGFIVTQSRSLTDRWKQQITPLGALACFVFQQALGKSKPTVRTPHLAAHKHARTKPERAADGAKRLAGLMIRIVGALQRAQVVFVSVDEVCGQRQQLKILSIE
jgi:hypothetical protein